MGMAVGHTGALGPTLGRRGMAAGGEQWGVMGDERERAKYLTNGGPPKPAFALTEEELLALMRRAVGDAMERSQQLLVDKQGLAQRLDCSAGHIDVLRKRGLPTVMVGQAVRFEPPAVLAWLREQSKSNDG